MLRGVDLWFVVAVIATGVALLLGALLARRTALLTRVRRALGAGDDDADLVVAASELRVARDAATAERTAADKARDQLLEIAGPGVVLTDAAFRIVAVNAVATELLGMGRTGLVGRTLMEAFLDRRVETAAGTALRRGSATVELQPAGTDGPTLAIRAHRAPDGGAWLLLDDVSELRRLQRIRSEFIDNLSHELRTPLTTVSLLAETLAREAAAADPAIPGRLRERITKIEIETGHLVQMVNELLDLSRIESGRTLALADGVDVGRLAADATERLRLFADRQGVTLRVEIEPELPPVRGDAARLGQVVVNLVHNAVKFSPDGGDVTVRVTRDDDHVAVAVEDHGVGIPKAAQERVFERFYKVDRARLRAGEGGGTGLGLAIARHVVEQHGGRITVDSEEGVGSTFRFALPIDPAVVAGSRAARASRPNRPGPDEDDGGSRGSTARRDAEHPEHR
jgi:two-component system phosphate regulon sensor histidine kinase PhoR